MSYIGVIASACLDANVLPDRFTRIEQLEGIPQDPHTSIVVCSRNGWLNNRVKEIAAATGISCLPVEGRDAIVLSGASLAPAAGELRRALAQYRGDPKLLPYRGVDNLSHEEVCDILSVVPASLAASIEQLNAADSRHEDGAHLEMLVGLLWCQLHLIEHASEQSLWFVSAVWPNDG